MHKVRIYAASSSGFILPWAQHYLETFQTLVREKKQNNKTPKSNVSSSSNAYSEEQIQMEFAGVKTKGSTRIQLGRNEYCGA